MGVLAKNGWSFSALGGEYVTRTVEITGSFRSISIQGDAAELEISTDTGDVKGSLLTEKVFITRSDTGRIRVPETVTGGKCKITTDTGNIEIEIQK